MNKSIMSEEAFNELIDEFDTILTKIENGALTKEEFLKKEMEINGNDV